MDLKSNVNAPRSTGVGWCPADMRTLFRSHKNGFMTNQLFFFNLFLVWGLAKKDGINMMKCTSVTKVIDQRVTHLIGKLQWPRLPSHANWQQCMSRNCLKSLNQFKTDMSRTETTLDLSQMAEEVSINLRKFQSMYSLEYVMQCWNQCSHPMCVQ